MRNQIQLYIIANSGLLGNKGRIPTYSLEYLRCLSDEELAQLRDDIATQRLSY